MSPAEIKSITREAISLEFQARSDNQVFAQSAKWDEARLSALRIHHIILHDRAKKTVQSWDDAALAIHATRPEKLPDVSENVALRSLEVIQYWIIKTQRNSVRFQHYQYESAPTATVHAT